MGYFGAFRYFPFGCVNRIIVTSINDGKGEHKVIA
jgi:hypothetical protein